MRAPEEALLDLARQRLDVRQREAAGQLRRRQPTRQLQQREWVAARLGHHPVSHTSVQPTGHRLEQRGRVGVAEPTDHQFGQAGQLLARLAHREHETDRLREEAAGDEAEDLRGHAVEPLRVVDDAQQRLLLGDVGQQPEDRQSHSEAIRYRAGAQPERGRERVSLRAGEVLQPVEHRGAQLVQTGELHLGLDAGGAHDAARPRVRHEVVQQRRLPDTRFAAHDEHLRPAGPYAVDELVQLPALSVPSPEVRAGSRRGGPANARVRPDRAT